MYFHAALSEAFSQMQENLFCPSATQCWQEQRYFWADIHRGFSPNFYNLFLRIAQV
jgi:hypothetical protein